MPAATAVRKDQAPPAEPKRAQYQALANLSISRAKGADPKADAADIVPAGETVWLTEDQAAVFLRGHKVPVIRPASQRNQPLRRIRARDLFRPMLPPFGVEPDPPGSTMLLTNPADPENAPESADPRPDLSVDPDAAKDR